MTEYGKNIFHKRAHFQTVFQFYPVSLWNSACHIRLQFCLEDLWPQIYRSSFC